jgi:hypothetical protein
MIGLVLALTLAAEAPRVPCWVTTTTRPNLPTFLLCTPLEIERGFILIPAEYFGDGTVMFPERRWKVEPADVAKVIRDGGMKRP